MTSTKISRRTTWQRSMLVAAIATPIAVVLATGSAVSAKKTILVPADASFECTDGPFIVATAPIYETGPASDPSTEVGPNVEVLVFQGNVKAAYEDGSLTAEPFATSDGKISDGESVEIPVPQGLYTVVFDAPSWYKSVDPVTAAAPDFKDDVVGPLFVTCGGGGGGGGGGYNFNLPRITTPPLPKTGGDNGSMLFLAPVMVLMGGALILVRRRLTTV